MPPARPTPASWSSDSASCSTSAASFSSHEERAKPRDAAARSVKRSGGRHPLQCVSGVFADFPIGIVQGIGERVDGFSRTANAQRLDDLKPHGRFGMVGQRQQHGLSTTVLEIVETLGRFDLILRDPAFGQPRESGDLLFEETHRRLVRRGVAGEGPGWSERDAGGRDQKQPDSREIPSPLSSGMVDFRHQRTRDRLSRACIRGRRRPGGMGVEMPVIVGTA